MSDSDRRLRFPVSRLDYDLPQDLIAQSPNEPRDSSRLLVVDRSSSDLHDRHFYDLPEILQSGDLLILNDTRVRPARLIARRATGGVVEVLVLARERDQTWRALAKPARRLKEGESLRILDPRDDETDATIRFIGRDGVQVTVEVDEATIERYGRVPLPPYIHGALDEPGRYQTVYATESGSSAAPTAGLHFTEELLARLDARGVERAFVTLHIGLDTFRPITTEDATEHQIHTEWFHVPESTLEAIASAKARGSRVVGVGTTVVRALESVARANHGSGDVTGWADLFIYPPFEFQVVDSMITNFHLPRTTLLLMVAAITGEELLWRAYRHAIEQRYRFYSFGDAMIIV